MVSDFEYQAVKEADNGGLAIA